jgi:hypothetical protein
MHWRRGGTFESFQVYVNRRPLNRSIDFHGPKGSLLFSPVSSLSSNPKLLWDLKQEAQLDFAPV